MDRVRTARQKNTSVVLKDGGIYIKKIMWYLLGKSIAPHLIRHHPVFQ